MAGNRLNLTRDQLASFLQDHEQIKQFELLFQTVDQEILPNSVTEANTLAGTAYAIGNEALAGIAALNDLVAPLVAAPPPSGGTVTSVAASGGTTGLTFSGSPITTSGTLVLGGTLAITNGGTGATNATDARTNLSAAKSGANSDITSLSGITGAISTVDSILFDTAAGVTVGAGRIAWNADDGTIDIGMGYDAVTQQVGLEQYFRIKASATITDGQCVMFDGSVGASGVLKGKPATGVTNPQYIMGVATMDIANNGFGYITSFGLVRGINTTGASVGETWVDGDILYYNPAYTGGLTKVEPIAPLPKVVVAAVVNAGSGGSGSLFVRVQAEPYLQGLTDVYAPSPIANGQILIGDGPQSRWESATLTAGTNVSITNGAGSITINATDQYVGTVTSVDLTAGTGISVSGGPITTAGSINVVNTAPDQIVSLTGAGTTVVTGTYPSFTITSNDQYVGTVTSVGGTGTVNGITLTGTVTSSGSLTLGGTLSGVSLTSQVTGTLPVGNGGTGATTLTSGYLLKGNGASAVTASIVYDDGTNVGIGTTPVQQNGRTLQVDGGAGPADFRLTNNATGAGFNNGGLYSLIGLDNYLWNLEAGFLSFGTNNAERVRINSSGNVLINETTPSAASLNHNFEVNGDIMSTGGAAGLFWANRSVAPTAGADWYGWYATGGTIYLYNPAAGNIASINTGTGAYTALSDAAKKKDFEPSAIGLDAVLALKPTLFRMETDDCDAPKQLGFIAQEVKDHIPQAYVEQQNTDATGNDTVYIGLNDRPIIAALVKAVQELTDRVKELEGNS